MNLETYEKKSNLTRFICTELLYEFVIGKLDTERQKEMDQYLSTCRDSQHELERLRRGFVFATLMAKTEVSPDLRQALLGFEPLWKKKLAQWTAWWSRRGWKLLPYFVITGVLVLGAVVMKPWQLLTVKDVVLVEEAKNESTSPTQPPADKTEKPQMPAAVGASTPVTADSSKKEVNSPPSVVASPTASPLAQPAEPASTESADVTADIPAEKAATHKDVLRGTMTITDFEVAWPAIRDKISALDGKVIGTIELGSQRKVGEAYFHFSLPESKQEEFETYLKNFGPVRFHKQADKRAMPEGENHIILTVKDGGPHEERKETETP